MRIIKPYGRSEIPVQPETQQGKRQRKVRLHGKLSNSLQEIPEFIKNNPKAVIKQWISIIDKIATKPNGNKKPTPEQRKLRDVLGKAAWLYLKSEVFDSTSDEDEKLWQAGIAPYPDGNASPKKSSHNKKTKPRKPVVQKKHSGLPNPKGRWYQRFVGDVEPTNVDESKAKEVAAKIYEHLYEKEYRIDKTRPKKQKGLISARAESIARNVLRPIPFEDRKWSDDDKETYIAGTDVAKEIKAKAEEARKKGNHVRLELAAKVLHEHYARLFKDKDGKPLSIAEAKEQHPGLFALHQDVKDAYTRILKRHKKSGRGKEGVARILPENMEALHRLITAKSINYQLNQHIRLGKVIHYEATGNGGDIVRHWPSEEQVENSVYWSSEGQHEIKRNEAFVRMWRNTVALAAQTLKDWADPEGESEKDILLEKNINSLSGEKFNKEGYENKLSCLFGSRRTLFLNETDPEDKLAKSVLHLALSGWSKLRHSSFHFSSRNDFAGKLIGTVEPTEATASASVYEKTRQLWKQDNDELNARLISEMQGAHFDYYFDNEKNQAILNAVSNYSPDHAPMPKFRRVLLRVENAWKKDKRFTLHLPKPYNREELQSHQRMCQYTALKMLYERAFPVWLENQSAECINKWIQTSVEHTTEEARSINERNVNNKEQIDAKAKGLIKLPAGKKIDTFIDRLSALTATEFRVQRGYSPDADSARKQSKYLDDLRCDCIAQAFEQYLKSNEFKWLLNDGFTGGDKPEEPISNLENLDEPERSLPDVENIDGWIPVLYFLIHMVPVDEISKLQNQLRKWRVKSRIEAGTNQQQFGDNEQLPGKIMRVFALYLDMHDAKFEGGVERMGVSALEGVFDKGVFERAFPAQPDGQSQQSDEEHYVPYRGLREVLRFGSLKPLMPIFKQFQITRENENNLKDKDKDIEGHQKKREELHKKWVDKKMVDKEEYRKTLDSITEHRHLSAHVRLHNHAKLHRLLMLVWARLLDFAGLWERDLYFVIVSLMYQRKEEPPAWLGEHPFVYAVTKNIFQKNHAIKGDIKTLFHVPPESQWNDLKNIRNDLAHFESLRKGNIDLTALTNRVRLLMAYDRKLKNAVSKSILELMAREKITLAWKMDDEHRLCNAQVRSDCATHLKGKSKKAQKKPRDKEQSQDNKITEALHGEKYMKMVALLFGGTVDEGARNTKRRKR